MSNIEMQCADEGFTMRMFAPIGDGGYVCLHCGWMQTSTAAGVAELCRNATWHDEAEYQRYAEVARSGGFDVPNLVPIGLIVPTEEKVMDPDVVNVLARHISNGTFDSEEGALKVTLRPDGKYDLKDGHHRLAAFLQAGKRVVPIEPYNPDDAEPGARIYEYEVEKACLGLARPAM